MCTAISINDTAHLFGRTLDLECSLGEMVTITPRHFDTGSRGEAERGRYAIIGMAHIADDRPLYYDAMNEHGLAVAALNFPVYAVYRDSCRNKRGIPSYALIPEVLGGCRSVGEAKRLLQDAVITSDTFDIDVPPTPLHWLIADKDEAITLETDEDGLKIYDNPIGVLSNSPIFPYQMARLSDYMALSPSNPSNHLAPSFGLSTYTRGLGAMGLPGDMTSSSRFVRAVYAKMHTRPLLSGEISRFFHIMGMVNTPYGTVTTDRGEAISTVYTSCMDLDEGIYYFTTYGNRRIRGVRLYDKDIDGKEILTYPIESDEEILLLN